MLSERHKILLLPFEITEFVHDNGLSKPFSLYLYLKMFAGGKVHETDEVFANLRQDLKMTDPKLRTFRKHLKTLLDLNWIGYNPNSGIYHIRSFDYIRAVNGFKKRKASKLFFRDIVQLQTYLPAVIICAAINGQKYYWEKGKGKLRTATKKRNVANQSRTSRRSSKPPYYGLCNKKLARLLGCKYTHACNLKQAAEEAGYLTTVPHYKDVQELDKADYLLRPMLAASKPEIAKRLRFWRKKKDGNGIVKVVQQLHDEIVPHIEFKRVVGFAALKVPFGIIKDYFKTPVYAKAA